MATIHFLNTIHTSDVKHAKTDGSVPKTSSPSVVDPPRRVKERSVPGGFPVSWPGMRERREEAHTVCTGACAGREGEHAPARTASVTWRPSHLSGMDEPFDEERHAPAGTAGCGSAA